MAPGLSGLTQAVSQLDEQGRVIGERLRNHLQVRASGERLRRDAEVEDPLLPMEQERRLVVAIEQLQVRPVEERRQLREAVQDVEVREDQALPSLVAVR